MLNNIDCITYSQISLYYFGKLFKTQMRWFKNNLDGQYLNVSPENDNVIESKSITLIIMKSIILGETYRSFTNGGSNKKFVTALFIRGYLYD